MAPELPERVCLGQDSLNESSPVFRQYYRGALAQYYCASLYTTALFRRCIATAQLWRCIAATCRAMSACTRRTPPWNCCTPCNSTSPKVDELGSRRRRNQVHVVGEWRSA